MENLAEREEGALGHQDQEEWLYLHVKLCPSLIHDNGVPVSVCVCVCVFVCVCVCVLSLIHI